MGRNPCDAKKEGSKRERERETGAEERREHMQGRGRTWGVGRRKTAVGEQEIQFTSRYIKK